MAWGNFKASQVQRLAKVGAPGLVNFITAVAYHFSPSLPAAFTQPGASTLADLCTIERAFKSYVNQTQVSYHLCHSVVGCDRLESTQSIISSLNVDSQSMIKIAVGDNSGSKQNLHIPLPIRTTLAIYSTPLPTA